MYCGAGKCYARGSDPFDSLAARAPKAAKPELGPGLPAAPAGPGKLAWPVVKPFGEDSN